MAEASTSIASALFLLFYNAMLFLLFLINAGRAKQSLTVIDLEALTDLCR